MVLLQTILIVILVYYGLKLLLKWLAPKLLNYAVKKTSERFGQQFGNPQDFDNAQKKEGETTISSLPPAAWPIGSSGIRSSIDWN